MCLNIFLQQHSFSPKEYDLSYSKLKKRINLEPTITNKGKKTGLINVKFTSYNPSKDLNLLKSIKDVFLNYSLNEREKKLNEIIGFINIQIPKLQNKLSESYEKLAKFLNRF